ncbi:MAG: methylated-DNA--[protein]-cysteine S-methyltransferase, partial [Candidatus Limnocylindria bacterium]
MALLRFARVETSLGPMLVAETDRGVAVATRDNDLPGLLAALRRRFPGIEPDAAGLDGGWVDAALDGGPLPPVDVAGLAAWDVRVFRAVRDVPFGATATYGEIAAAVGSPRAARAVGGALGRCPFFPAVPCHRVVRAADGWSGWGPDVR